MSDATDRKRTRGRSAQTGHVLEWRELQWHDPLTVSSAGNALEQLTASGVLGLIVLELRATAKGARWLIGAAPTRIADVVAALESHVSVRAHTPRRRRKDVDRSGKLRLTGGHLSLDPDRIQATVRGLYGVLSRLDSEEEVVLQLMLGRRLLPPLGDAPPSWFDLLIGTSKAEPPAGGHASSKRRSEQHGAHAQVRIGIRSSNQARAILLGQQIAGALRVLEIPAAKLHVEADRAEHLNAARRPWRWNLRLSSGELIALTGWPIGEPPLPMLGSIHPRVVLPKQTLVATERVIGWVDGGGNRERVGIPIRDAASHTHFLGPTGAAKSTVMLSLITADMDAGRGVLVLDPKGDLADDVLACVPANRLQDVVVLDPTNASPVGFNPLAGPASQADIRADTLLSIFEAIFAENWGIRSADVFSSVFLTLARIPEANLLWIPPLLTNPAFRKKVLKQIDDPLGVGAFWAQYDAKKPDQQAVEIAPVLNKLRQLILRPGLRAVLGQSHPAFDIGELFSKRRIVIVNLNKGLLGADAARLLGSLIIGQLWARILARQALPPERRHIVGIYIDEVNDFLSGLPGDLSDALAQARSLGAAFTVANQYLSQFTPGMGKAIETNTRSKLYFGLAASDAASAAKGALGLDAQDFQLLPPYHAYANVLQQGHGTGWISIATVPPVPPRHDAAEVYAASHSRYGRNAKETERELLKLIAPTEPPDEPDDPGPIGRSKR